MRRAAGDGDDASDTSLTIQLDEGDHRVVRRTTNAGV